MQWLIGIIKESLGWLVKNPILLVLIVLLIAYNRVVGSDSLRLNDVDWLSGASLLSAAEALFVRATSPLGILLFLVGFIVAAALSLFVIGTNFAVFAGKPNKIRCGLNTMCSWGTLQLFIVQVVTNVLAALALLGIGSVVVRMLGLSGLSGAIIAFLFAVIGYPLAFMALATISTIVAVPVPLSHKWRLVRMALEWPNLSRLIVFYVSRISIEMVFLAAAILIAAHFQLSLLYSTLLIIAVVIVPFALIRTGGFLLKFDVFKEDPWFKEYFRTFYMEKPRS